MTSNIYDDEKWNGEKGLGIIYGKWVQGTGDPGGSDRSFEMELGALIKTTEEFIKLL